MIDIRRRCAANNTVRVIPKLIPRMEQRMLCATFLEAALRFYKEPKNEVAFQKWRMGKGGNAYGQKDSDKTAEGVP